MDLAIQTEHLSAPSSCLTLAKEHALKWKRGPTRMTDSEQDLKPITVNCRNRYFMHSWILSNLAFLCSLCRRGRNEQPSNTCWVLFCLLPARRIALTRWLALKKRIQINLSSRARRACPDDKGPNGRLYMEKSHPVSIVIFSHLFIYSQIYTARGWMCSDSISPQVDTVQYGWCTVHCCRYCGPAQQLNNTKIL